MGQIVSNAAKPKRCNANRLSQVPTPADGEYILVSSDNSMNAAGQGNFDCYIMGDGTKAATELELRDIDEGTYKAVFGYTRSTYEEQAFIENKYCNTKGTSIIAESTLTTLDGTNCVYLYVNAGEKYRIFGNGPSTTISLYALAQSDRTIVTKSGQMDARTNGVVVEIPEGVGILVVNLYNYDALTDKVEKITDVNIEGLQDKVDKLSTSIAGYDAAIEALDEDINGVKKTEEISCQLTSDAFFNTATHFRDSSTTYYKTNPAALSGCYCLKQRVLAGEQYHIHHQAGNGTAAIGLYIYTDDSNNVVSSKQAGTDEAISIPLDGYLYVNLYQYDSATDYVKKVVQSVVGGYKGYVNEKIAESNQLYGKKIVCFGDSLTEFKDAFGKSYSDYIAELYGADVINCGIGGTRFMQRTTPVLNPSTSEEGYAGLDIISMVRAACGVEFDGSHSYADVVENAAIYIRDHESDDNTPIVQRMLAIDWSTVDAVIVFAGTNDWNNGVGHWGTTGSSDVNTTMGAINEIIRLLLSTYKHIKLYWVTPIVRWINYSGGTGNPDNFSDNFVKSLSGESGTLKQFSQMIENEVVLSHIPICDAYNTLGWNMHNFSQYFPDSDGTHPTKGFKQLAEKIASFMISNKTF